MRIFMVLQCLLISAKAISAKEIIYPPRPVDWYDCSGKVPGRYMHAIDCTKFIVCDLKGNAFEVRCPTCHHIGLRLCPHGRLVFNNEEKICYPSALVECKVAFEDYIDPPTGPSPGDECDPMNCVNVGYSCNSYLRCEKKESKWIEEECGKGLYWNPQNLNGTEQIHGGNCDFLENLLGKTLERYKKDHKCNLK